MFGLTKIIILQKQSAHKKRGLSRVCDVNNDGLFSLYILVREGRKDGRYTSLLIMKDQSRNLRIKHCDRRRKTKQTPSHQNPHTCAMASL